MSRFSYQVGNVKTGEWDGVWLPRTPRGSTKFGVMLLHGKGDAEPDNPGWTTLSKLIYVLNEAGIPVGSAYLAGDPWGNNEVANNTAAGLLNKLHARTALLSGCSTAKIHVIGLSMGAANAVRWASLNPTKAASVQGFIPVSNIKHMYDNDTGNVGFRASIGTAWGITYPTAFPMTGSAGGDLIGVHAPVLLANSIPTRFFYASDDPFILSSHVQSMATASGSSAINLGPGGHTNTAVSRAEVHNGGADWSDMVSWLVARGA